MYRLVLTGALENKTITLNGIRFKDGRATLKGATHENLSLNYGGVLNYFKKCYQTRLEEVPDDTEIYAQQHNPEGDIQQDGQGIAETPIDDGQEDVRIDPAASGDFPSRDGYENSRISDTAGRTPRELRIISAVENLDAGNDDNWTQLGLVRVDVIETVMGDPSVTRREIEALMPGYMRPGMEGK